MHNFDLIVIGSGPGGQRAATQAANLRKRVAMCEKYRDTGGSLDRDSGLVAALRRHEPRAADALVDAYGGRAESPRPQYEKHAETPDHDGRLTSRQ